MPSQSPKLPSVRTRGQDLVFPMQAWWKAKTIDEVLSTTSFAQAMADVGMLSMWHLAKRLASPKTPDRVKDRLAAIVTPRTVIQLGGKAPKDKGGAGASLLAAYKVEAGAPAPHDAGEPADRSDLDPTG